MVKNISTNPGLLLPKMALKREGDFVADYDGKRIRQSQEYVRSLNSSIIVTPQLATIVDRLSRCRAACISSLLLGPSSCGKSTCIDYFLAKGEARNGNNEYLMY